MTEIQDFDDLEGDDEVDDFGDDLPDEDLPDEYFEGFPSEKEYEIRDIKDEVTEEHGLTLEQHEELEYEPELGQASRFVDPDFVKLPHDQSLEIMDRDVWCDEPPVSVIPMTTTPTLVRVLHTHTKKKIKNREESRNTLYDLFETQYQPFNQGYRDIRYNFAIGVEGEIYECRGWNVKPEPLPHPIDNTEERLDIAYIGNYARYMPSYVMMESMISLIQYGIKNKLINPGCKVKHLDHALRFKSQKAYRDINDLLI